MRATVTLWSEGPGGARVGISEFVLYEPDEARFLVRARCLFAMVAEPLAPICARLLACGGCRELDATMSSPDRVAARLWLAYQDLCESEPCEGA